MNSPPPFPPNAKDQDSAGDATRQTPFAALRRFVRPRPAKECCELCSAELAPEHQHLLDLASRQLVCACDPCAILFSSQQSGQYRRVPRRIQFWPDFVMSDAQWDSLYLPINLAFFIRREPAGKIAALYPSPAGVTESQLALEAWQDLVQGNPVLQELEPDVEALLVNRVREAREVYRAPIDECYRLVGLIRAHWRGLSGGPAVWEEVGRFFRALKQRAGAAGGRVHA